MLHAIILFIGIVVGTIIGIIGSAIFISTLMYGTIRSDDGESLYLELNDSSEYIKHRKYVLFRVKFLDNPQK